MRPILVTLAAASLLVLAVCLPGSAMAQNSASFAFISDSFGDQNAPALASMRALDPLGFFIIGDFDHSNPGANVTNATAALTKARGYFRRLYEGVSVLGADYADNILDGGPPLLARIMDDHEVKDNASNNWRWWAQTLQAFLEYHAVPPDNGFALGYQYQALRVGDVQFLLLDLRTHRETEGPHKTILGAEQKVWLSARLTAVASDPSVQWTVLVSTVPINPRQAKKDSWSGFPADRQWLLDQIATAGLQNVLVVSGDCHWGSIGLPPLTPVVELNIPQLNPGFSNTCNHNPSQWSLTSTAAGTGFGVLTLDADAAGLTIYNANGTTRLQATVPRVTD